MAEVAEAPAEEEKYELPHLEIPESFAPQVDFSAIEARLKLRLEEQVELMAKQEELREKLKAIGEACIAEEEARQTLEETIAGTSTELEETVKAACEPVEQIAEQRASATESLSGVYAAEEALRASVVDSLRIDRPAADRVATAGRQVEEWQRRVVELDAEATAQAAVAEDLETRSATMAQTVADETAAAEALRQKVLEKQLQLYSAAPPRASDEARQLEEELWHGQQRSMQNTQRLLGYVLKVAGKLASGDRGQVLPWRPPETDETAWRRDLSGGHAAMATAWRRDLTAGYGAMHRCGEKRLVRMTLQMWRMQCHGLRRLRQVQRTLINGVRDAQEVLPPLGLAERLAELARRTDALAATKLHQDDYDRRVADYDAMFAELTRLVPPFLAEMGQQIQANELGADLDELDRTVESHDRDLSGLEDQARIVDHLKICASADDMQKLVGQVVAIWNDVKRADEEKAGQQQLTKVRESIQAVWADCAEDASVLPDSLVSASTVGIKERIAHCKTEVDANHTHFAQLEGMLSQLATFVEEMVAELHKLESA